MYLTKKHYCFFLVRVRSEWQVRKARESLFSESWACRLSRLTSVVILIFAPKPIDKNSQRASTKKSHIIFSLPPLRNMPPSATLPMDHVTAADTSSTSHDGPAQYRVSNQIHSDPRKICVICIGAGFSGLCLAYKMKQSMTNYELVCYEKFVFNPVNRKLN